jgi:branched-chain amino acid transport system substrate-binding protein
MTALLGIVTTLLYSALHGSPLNKVFVEVFEAAYGQRPSFVSLGGYDRIHLIYEALKRMAARPTAMQCWPP